MARIRAEFPKLAFARTRLEDSGADHRLVILDEEWVFRFPRTAERVPLFRAELQILEALRGAPVPPIPDYVFVSGAGVFGGYRLIAGEPLRARLFRALPGPIQGRILEEIAALLRAVHALTPAAITPPGVSPAREWSPADWTARYDAERRGQIAPFVPPELLPAIDGFYRAFARRPVSERAVVIHGDLSDDHLLLAPERDRLAGVIDFGDACLGDPAYDFTFFFAFGQAAAQRLATLYDPSGADPGLIERARWSYARYRIEQLRWIAMGAVPDQSAEIIAELPGLLSMLAKGE
ncbi:MAG TPA: aminoglycoside phosphotransferase family protein [Caulobacteraceae bacterium]|nr:aminoglycoside phosphotransferase family protein [Caulobacteraceae bacterium]